MPRKVNQKNKSSSASTLNLFKKHLNSPGVQAILKDNTNMKLPKVVPKKIKPHRPFGGKPLPKILQRVLRGKGKKNKTETRMSKSEIKLPTWDQYALLRCVASSDILNKNQSPRIGNDSSIAIVSDHLKTSIPVKKNVASTSKREKKSPLDTIYSAGALMNKALNPETSTFKNIPTRQDRLLKLKELLQAREDEDASGNEMVNSIPMDEMKISKSDSEKNCNATLQYSQNNFTPLATSSKESHQMNMNKRCREVKCEKPTEVTCSKDKNTELPKGKNEAEQHDMLRMLKTSSVKNEDRLQTKIKSSQKDPNKEILLSTETDNDALMSWLKSRNDKKGEEKFPNIEHEIDVPFPKHKQQYSRIKKIFNDKFNTKAIYDPTSHSVGIGLLMQDQSQFKISFPTQSHNSSPESVFGSPHLL